MSDVGAVPVDLRSPVVKATVAGQDDGKAGKPMDPYYTSGSDVGTAKVAKDAYIKAYNAAKAASGAARRRRRTQKRKGGKARKTRGRK